MTELTEVEFPVVRWLDKYKIKHRKMNGTGQRGWPDRLICLPLYPLWIEFKREGEELRKLQVYRVRTLRELGYEVEIYDNAKDAIECVQRAVTQRLVAARLSEESDKVHAAELVCRTLLRSWIREDEYQLGSDKNSKARKTGK